METERQIVYSILNTIRNHSHNIDEDITERLLRSHVLSYRADSIRKHYKNGHTIEDQVFQRVTLPFLGTKKHPITKKINKEFTAALPKLIRMDNHYGLRLERLSIMIPVLDSELYSLTKKNSLNNKKVFAKTDTKFAQIYIGDFKSCASSESEVQILINDIIQEIQDQQNNNEEVLKLKFDLYAVLYNPSDDPSYDWENDIFPFPAERNPELKMQILKNEFGIIVDLRAKKDEVQNARPDNIRYHEEQNIQE